jgi:streptogramin lyase
MRGGVCGCTGSVLARRRGLTGGTLALLVSLAVVLSFSGSALAAPLGQVTEFSAGLNAGSFPVVIAPGADGNLWFTDAGTTMAIGRITPSGAITEFSTGLNAGGSPVGIAPGADGNLWFTDGGTTKAIGRITPSGAITEFSTGLNAGSDPRGIAPSADGNLWFTDGGTTKAIGRITPSGTITEFSAGLNAGSSPEGGITPGADGNLWFDDQGTTEAIGRITPSGTITEFSTGAGSSPEGIAPGADGNLWFDDPDTHRAIGRFGAGAPAASVRAPSVTGSGQQGTQQVCQGAQWSTWAGQLPSVSAFSFDGYQWLRDASAIAGQTAQSYTPPAGDVGHALSCTVTVTYPLLEVTTAATSAAVTVTAPAATTTPTSPTATPTSVTPSVANATQSHLSWREGNGLASFARKSKAPLGTTFSFTLNEQASVSFAFTQQVAGRKAKGKCVAKTKKNRKMPSCKRTVTQGTLSFTGHTGTNKVSFQGRVSASKKLQPGRYTLLITATNAVGQRSQTQSLSFTTVR